ncbi:MAG: hypothetical protein WA323_18110 [Candidatus Nitrosopolaris sp.]
MAYRLVLNDKIIWDNVEFERILLDGPKNYLPPKVINHDVASIGDWYISIQSTIRSNAIVSEVIDVLTKLRRN